MRKLCIIWVPVSEDLAVPCVWRPVAGSAFACQLLAQGVQGLSSRHFPLWASAPSVSRSGHEMLLQWPLVGPAGFPNPQKQKCQGSFPLVGNFLEYQHKEALEECSLYPQVSVQTIFSIHLFFRSHLPFFSMIPKFPSSRQKYSVCCTSV